MSLIKLDYVVLHKKKKKNKTKQNQSWHFKAIQSYLLILLGLLTNGIAISSSYDTASLNRTSFPSGFIFGTASASYQVSKSQFSLCKFIS